MIIYNEGGKKIRFGLFQYPCCRPLPLIPSVLSLLDGTSCKTSHLMLKYSKSHRDDVKQTLWVSQVQHRGRTCVNSREK